VTCHRPVIPGTTHRGVASARFRMRKNHPADAASALPGLNVALSTFQSCGVSSRLKTPQESPHACIRGSSATLKKRPRLLLSFRRPLFQKRPHRETMVRNFVAAKWCLPLASAAASALRSAPVPWNPGFMKKFFGQGKGKGGAVKTGGKEKGGGPQKKHPGGGGGRCKGGPRLFLKNPPPPQF